MTQNRSTAVMQRRKEPHNSLDDFPTPPWATRAVCEYLRFIGETIGEMKAREPAANRGHMAGPLKEYFQDVEASDIHDYGVGIPVNDYLFGPHPSRVDWTITNPPFRLAEQFISRALATSDRGVAMIVRTAFLEGINRYQNIFAIHRPAFVLQFTERVVMHRGKLSEKGSTATAYCWVIWRGETPYTEFDWIHPCRKRLERPGDYPKEADQ